MEKQAKVDAKRTANKLLTKVAAPRKALQTMVSREGWREVPQVIRAPTEGALEKLNAIEVGGGCCHAHTHTQVMLGNR